MLFYHWYCCSPQLRLRLGLLRHVVLISFVYAPANDVPRAYTISAFGSVVLVDANAVFLADANGQPDGVA